MTRKNYKALHERVLARPGAEERVAKLREGMLVEVGLSELRRARRVSQMDLAERLDVTQSAISRFERGADPRLSTLRDYVEGVGGHLELRVRFGDEEILLSIGKDDDARAQSA